MHGQGQEEWMEVALGYGLCQLSTLLAEENVEARLVAADEMKYLRYPRTDWRSCHSLIGWRWLPSMTLQPPWAKSLCIPATLLFPGFCGASTI